MALPGDYLRHCSHGQCDCLRAPWQAAAQGAPQAVRQLSLIHICTRLNGEKLPANEMRRLNSGDSVTIGYTTLKIFFDIKEML